MENYFSTSTPVLLSDILGLTSTPGLVATILGKQKPEDRIGRNVKIFVKVHPGQTSRVDWKYSNGTPKVDLLQKCSARGRCQDGSHGTYNVDNPRILELFNLTVYDSTEYWYFIYFSL